MHPKILQYQKTLKLIAPVIALLSETYRLLVIQTALPHHRGALYGHCSRDYCCDLWGERHRGVVEVADENHD